jgi:hypothetical protein
LRIDETVVSIAGAPSIRMASFSTSWSSVEFRGQVWRRRRIGEGQDGAGMDSTRHGTLGLFGALDAAALLTCIYTVPAANRRAMARSAGVTSDVTAKVGVTHRD